MIFKTLYYLTFLIPVIFIGLLIWTNSLSGKWEQLNVVIYFLGFLWVAVPISLAWIVYCASTKDLIHAWASIVFLLAAVSLFGYQYTSQVFKTRAEEKEKAVWLASAENKHFSSEKLGVSFDYISERPFHHDAVTVKEQGDVVSILLGDDPEGGGALQVFVKEPNSTLLSFLQKKYAKDFPKCRFANLEPNTYRISFKSGYELVVAYDDSPDNRGCPVSGIERIKGSGGGILYIMDAKYPEKYVGIASTEYPVGAFKPTKENPFSISWYESIVIK